MRKLTFIEKSVRPVLDDAERKALEFGFNKKFENQISLGKASQNPGSRERFVLEDSFNVEQVQLRVTLQAQDGSRGYPVESILCLPEQESSDEVGTPQPKKELAALLDFQEAYWTEYFQSGRETFVTLDWSEHHFAGYQIFIRGFERNFALEKAADALFAEHGMGSHDIEPISAET